MIKTLNLENFGQINNANIEINKINVIAGKNSSGKSILSKLLFSFLLPVSNEGNYIINSQIKEFFSNFIENWSMNFSKNSNEYEQLLQLLNKWDDSRGDIEYFISLYETLDYIVEKLDLLDKGNCKSDLNRIKTIIDLNKDIMCKFENITKDVLNSEFGLLQLRNYQNGSKASLKGDYNNKNFNNIIIFNEDGFKVDISENYLNSSKFKEVYYIDSQFVFNLTDNMRGLPYHLKLLSKNLKSNDNVDEVYDEVLNKDLICFENDLAELIGGKFYYDDSLDMFYFKSISGEFEIWNIASGFRQLGILQLLFAQRKISENSFIIFDDVELNLHPELQVRLGEILVKMVKDLGLTLYINSHSPFIIEAIEVFSMKYGLLKDVNFYLADSIGDNKFNFKRISKGNLDELYSNLALPFDELNTVRFKYSLKEKYGL